jgi:replicative DNA helicase
MELDLMFLKKTPPQSLEAERAVLGGILVQKENLNVVLSTISPDDLYKDAHRRILEAITALVDKGLPVDLLSLTEELQRAGILEDVGGAAYLSGLLDGVPRNLNVEYYAQIIKEKALLRRLILSSAKIISESYEQKEDADELLNAAQAAIVEVAEQRLKPGFQSMNVLMPPTLDMIQTLVDRKEAVTGVPSGFRYLDGLTAGFHPAELVILAARPSMGKTALALNISHHVGLKTDKAVGFFSMEMAKEQLVIRLL